MEKVLDIDEILDVIAQSFKIEHEDIETIKTSREESVYLTDGIGHRDLSDGEGLEVFISVTKRNSIISISYDVSDYGHPSINFLFTLLAKDATLSRLQLYIMHFQKIHKEEL